MNTYRIFRMHGYNDPGTTYNVTVNNKVVKGNPYELFSFITNTKLYGSVNVVITVISGSITLTGCSVTYPALFNGVEGTTTLVQPIEEPVAVVKNGLLETMPFPITLKEGEQFSYKHLMFNGPTRFNITVKDINLFPCINVYLGDFLKDEFNQSIIDFKPEYEYNTQPTDLGFNDLKKLKEKVLNLPL